MGTKYDLIGQRFGSLLVTEKINKNDRIKYNINPKNNQTYWVCACDCGNTSIQPTSSLTSGKSTMCWECGHYITASYKQKEYKGLKIGALTILETIHPSREEHKDNNKKPRTKVRCICDCGQEVTRLIDSLMRQKDNPYVSCGCLKTQRINNTFSVIGKKFGKLTVIEEILNDGKYYKSKLKCLCDCGEVTIKNRADVLSRHTTSCGCEQKRKASESNTIDFRSQISDYGIRFIKPAYKNKAGHWVWLCQCGFCSNTFEASPAKVLNNHIKSCGCLATSSGERLVSKILDSHNINYIPQYSFPDCKDKNKLKFDFAIVKNNTITNLIEFDGEQHFREITFFGGRSNFEALKKRDKIKDNYAYNNNIPLTRIPYYLSKEQIEKIIVNVINA